jgi:GT2 family glycosyltransferase
MKVSVVIVTYNSGQYVPRLFESLQNQTVFNELEVIIMDNGSTDNTVALCRQFSSAWPKAAVIEPLGQNFGYAVSTNTGVKRATGEYVFNLNADTWLEPDCIQILLQALANSKAASACAAQAEMDSNQLGASSPNGFDIFGRPTWSEFNPGSIPESNWQYFFMVAGAGFLTQREAWNRIGGYDNKHFMYAEDDDISWKLWLAGYQNIYVHNAIVHHRSGRGWEIKEFTRYLVNRNSLLVVAKNAQHILLLCGLLQVLMLIGEALLLLVISRNWKFVWNSYFKAIIDVFKMWPHILEMRRFNRRIRRRSDWAMARMFLRWRINRWDMVKAFFLKGERPVVKPTG